ncbi:MAG: DUF2878 family protein [Xanthomonadales bacterium]|nr:DUF2878 family protein [Xanthomonadales bacterium]
MKLFINFAAFQLGWFSCVLGAANGVAWIGPPVVLGVVVLHLAQAARPPGYSSASADWRVTEHA